MTDVAAGELLNSSVSFYLAKYVKICFAKFHNSLKFSSAAYFAIYAKLFKILQNAITYQSK